MTDTNAPVDSAVAKRYAIEQRVKSGANWFYWIAGLSILNTTILVAGKDIYFPVGLGITLVITTIASEVGAAAQVLGLGMNLLAAGMFVFLGVMARKRLPWAFIVGLVLYGLDGLLLLLAQDLIGLAFHALAFASILGGLKAANRLNRERAVPFSEPVVETQRESLTS